MSQFADSIGDVEFELTHGKRMTLAAFCDAQFSKRSAPDVRNIARAALVLKKESDKHRDEDGKLPSATDDSQYHALRFQLSQHLRLHDLYFGDVQENFEVSTSTLIRKSGVNKSISQWNEMDIDQRELLLLNIAAHFEKLFGKTDKKIHVLDITDNSPPFAEGFFEDNQYHIRRTAITGSFGQAFGALLDSFSAQLVDDEKLNKDQIQNLAFSDQAISEDDVRSVLLTLDQDYLFSASEKTGELYTGPSSSFIVKARSSVKQALRNSPNNNFELAGVSSQIIKIRALNAYAEHQLGVQDRVSTPVTTPLRDAEALVNRS